MRPGTLPTVTLADATGVSHRYARLCDVWSHPTGSPGAFSYPTSPRSSVTYNEAYHALRRLGLAVE